MQFIDGPTGDVQIFSRFDQATLERWFDEVEPMTDDEKAAFYFLTDSLGYTVSDALDAIDDVMLFHGYLEAAASEIFDDLHAPTIPAFLLRYFDISAFARDLEISGDLAPFRFNDSAYVVTNASGL